MYDKILTVSENGMIYVVGALLWSVASAQDRLLIPGDQFRLVEESSHVLLTCTTPDNSPTVCSVGWLKDVGSRVQNDSHYTLYCNGSLLIRDITRELIGDGAPFRCYDGSGVYRDSEPVLVMFKRKLKDKCSYKGYSQSTLIVRKPLQDGLCVILMFRSIVLVYVCKLQLDIILIYRCLRLW